MGQEKYLKRYCLRMTQQQQQKEQPNTDERYQYTDSKTA